jgi:hypothetical protein
MQRIVAKILNFNSFLADFTNSSGAEPVLCHLRPTVLDSLTQKFTFLSENEAKMCEISLKNALCCFL